MPKILLARVRSLSRRSPGAAPAALALAWIVAASGTPASRPSARPAAEEARRPAAGPQAPSRRGAEAPYFPERGEWQTRRPEEVGLDAARLDEAIRFAVAHENPATRDLATDIALTFSREPHNALIGPTAPRAPLNGLVVRRGYVVAEWGETDRPDMTFSVTKSFLSTVVGLAWQRGLIRDVGDRVAPYMPRPSIPTAECLGLVAPRPPEEACELFASPKNAAITWDHLLRQTSDWEGTLWGKPDWADRPEGERPSEYPNRKRYEPGTRYKYNDVRVNVLALAALHVWRRPLPEVLREEVMDPIGASSTWRWYGYENSWVLVDGRWVQSVSGGGHWGGGLFIGARDLARFGLLFLRHGRWRDRRIVSERWIAMARTPGTANPAYGYMNWFLNTGRTSLPSAPESSVTFRGNGQNIVYIDWENDLVVVVRWIRGDALDEFIGKVLAAVRAPAPSARAEPAPARSPGASAPAAPSRRSSRG
jgi:CubicO group peptidase (beta-lactamase class C family)